MGYEGRIPALSMRAKSTHADERRSQGGRVFFSSTGRSLEGEDEIVVLSVGVDIGSSTSHLVFSRIVLERLDSRYVVTERETFYASDILLTPYSAENTIDADALGAFIAKEYADAKVDPDEIDTGALILTGVAVQRKNARAIGELFAKQAGKLVAVSAGDSLETVMAAYGSGAAARSIRDECVVMNVDVGGGTSKIAVCADGKVIDLTAVDVGARLVCLEPDGRITRVEDAGRRYGAGARHRSQGRRHADARPGPRHRRADGRQAVRGDARRHADRAGRKPAAHRSPRPSQARSRRSSSPAACRSSSTATRRRNSATSVRCWRRKSAPASRRSARGLEPSIEGIRATVVGASQYTIQLSGSTIYVAPLDAVPLRNVPVIAPALPLDGETIDPAAVARATQAMLKRLDLNGGEQPVAVFVPWQGSATFQRLDAFCRGMVEGLVDGAGERPSAGAGRRRRRRRPARHPPARRDEARESGGVDRRARAQGVRLHRHRHHAGSSGAVPVVIKSLIFPGSVAS